MTRSVENFGARPVETAPPVPADQADASVRAEPRAEKISRAQSWAGPLTSSADIFAEAQDLSTQGGDKMPGGNRVRQAKEEFDDIVAKSADAPTKPEADGMSPADDPQRRVADWLNDMPEPARAQDQMGGTSMAADSRAMMEQQQEQARTQMWASHQQAMSNSALEHTKDMMNQNAESMRAIRNNDRKLATEAVADEANLIKDTHQQMSQAGSV